MMKLLVVGDEPRITGAIARYFNRLGYCAATAGSCEEALELLAGEPFDVVITDLQSARTSDRDIISHLRNNCPLTRVIAISGKYTHGYTELADVDYFFEKPFLLNDIEKAVKTFAEKTLPA
jgi:DNA-binding NtrC family response regulator